jgi:hypothetical protein
MERFFRVLKNIQFVIRAVNLKRETSIVSMESDCDLPIWNQQKMYEHLTDGAYNNLTRITENAA